MGITACFDGDLCKSSRLLRHYSRLTQGWGGGGCFTDTALDLLGLAQGKGVVVGHSEERANMTTTMRSLCHSELSLPKGHQGDRGG